MQTLLEHSAFWRGVSLFAGMLFGKPIQHKVSGIAIDRGIDLVCWSPGARSRREDELARMRRTQSP